MPNISSKYLNLEGLLALLESSKNTSEFDGALIMTSVGMIAGKLVPVYSTTDIPHAAELVYDYKAEYVKSLEKESEEKVKIIGDGSLIVMEEATIIYGNNVKIDIEEITIHCSDVIGFSPINIENFKSNLI